MNAGLKIRREEVEINTKVERITREENKKEGLNAKMKEGQSINLKEIESKISKEKTSITKMKETRDLLATKTIGEKMKDLKSNIENKDQPLKKTKNLNKEETITKKTNDLLIEK